jgi:hypothetical protein
MVETTRARMRGSRSDTFSTSAKRRTAIAPRRLRPPFRPSGFRRQWNGARMSEFEGLAAFDRSAASPRFSGMQPNRDATGEVACDSIRDTEVHGCPSVP